MSRPPIQKRPSNNEEHWDQKLYAAGKKLFTQFAMMLKTATLYEPHNNAFTTTVEALKKDFDEVMERATPLKIELIEDNLFLNQEKIKADLYTYNAQNIIQEEFRNKKISGLVFELPPTLEELKSLMILLARFRPTDKEDYQQLNAQLQEKKIQHVRALEFRKRIMAAIDESTVASNKASAVRNYVRAVQMMKDAVTNMQEKRGFDPRQAKRIVYNLVNHSFDEGYAFMSLATIKNYDVSTYHHCVNVCVIAITFGQNLGLSKRQLADLGIASLYHDIGKVDIPKEILNKPGRFTDDEWRIMKQHPVMAIQHLLPLHGASDSDIKKAIPAFEHHRDFDLSGYPPMTLRKPLNFYSKVVAIADAYDAMTSSRVYQKGLTPSEALQIILKGAGKKFDPVLVKAFVNTVGIYPVGSVVQLNNGDIGIVSETDGNLNRAERPKLVIVMNKHGVAKKPLNVDMSDPQYSALMITQAVSAEDYKINVAHYLLGT